LHLKYCGFDRQAIFAGAAKSENKTRFATESKGHEQKRQRIGWAAAEHPAKRETRWAFLASPKIVVRLSR
jgi:hypothetical protein